MRIAQVAPLTESVPPSLYGGTERVVSYLTEELMRQGHEVTLFASGDSRTSARLVPVVPRALRLLGRRDDAIAWHTLMCERVFGMHAEFDVIHMHVDALHYPVARRSPCPSLTTLHGRLDADGTRALHRHFPEVAVSCISQHQRAILGHPNGSPVVYHGLPKDLYRYTDRPADYFAFLGRICPEKRLDRAIAIAVACGERLRVAAKVDDADREYFKREIRHLLDHPLVEYIGEIGDADKSDFLGRARALLFPIDWPEPFGLVLIEAFACGTPVVAYRGGSVDEVMVEGVTGYIVDNDADAAHAARRVHRLERRLCRNVFEERYTASRMAQEYVRIYEDLLRVRTWKRHYAGHYPNR